MIRQARQRPHRAPAFAVALRLGPVVLTGTAINSWPRRFLDGSNATPRTAWHPPVVAWPGCRQPDYRGTSSAVSRHHRVPGLKTVADQECPSAGQQLHHLTRPASHGSVSRGLVVRDWRLSATRAAPRALAAAVEPAGRDGGQATGCARACHPAHLGKRPACVLPKLPLLGFGSFGGMQPGPFCAPRVASCLHRVIELSSTCRWWMDGHLHCLAVSWLHQGAHNPPAHPAPPSRHQGWPSPTIGAATDHAR
ncbi:MAG: hypothetical protein RSP_15770 [Rhodanobacter sp.]